MNIHAFSIFGARARRRIKLAVIGSMTILTGSLFLGGCQSLLSSAEPDQSEPGNLEVAVTSNNTKTGVQLWSEHCGRCHNVRDPSALSDAQWDVAMLHMRVRANLTAADADAIRDFILTAN